MNFRLAACHSYTLTWVPELGIFKLQRNADGKSRPVTEAEIRSACEGNAGWSAWVDFAKAHPGTPCEYGGAK